MDMSIKEQLKIINDELEAEALSNYSNEEKVLHQVCRKLLCLERDLNATGSNSPEEVRIERLMEALTKESF